MEGRRKERQKYDSPMTKSLPRRKKEEKQE